MAEDHILVVEDEAVARRVLHDMLARAGYKVTAVNSGEEALERLEIEAFDLVLTDLKLSKVGGKIDGMEVVRSARGRDPNIETIILTGYATLDSAVAAVRNGASNYILKPGQPGEIENSVAEALARRRERLDQAADLRQVAEIFLKIPGVGRPIIEESPSPQAPPPVSPPASPIDPAQQAHVVSIGPLELDQRRYSAMLEGTPLNLSLGEFALLTYLAQRHQQVISPQQLAHEVMGYRCDPHEARDLIKARIWALRRKLERDPANPEMLLSVRGVGYMLALKDAATSEE